MDAETLESTKIWSETLYNGIWMSWIAIFFELVGVWVRPWGLLNQCRPQKSAKIASEGQLRRNGSFRTESGQQLIGQVTDENPVTMWERVEELVNEPLHLPDISGATSQKPPPSSHHVREWWSHHRQLAEDLQVGDLVEAVVEHRKLVCGNADDAIVVLSAPYQDFETAEAWYENGALRDTRLMQRPSEARQKTMWYAMIPFFVISLMFMAIIPMDIVSFGSAPHDADPVLVLIGQLLSLLIWVEGLVLHLGMARVLTHIVPIASVALAAAMPLTSTGSHRPVVVERREQILGRAEVIEQLYNIHRYMAFTVVFFLIVVHIPPIMSLAGVPGGFFDEENYRLIGVFFPIIYYVFYASCTANMVGSLCALTGVTYVCFIASKVIRRRIKQLESVPDSGIEAARAEFNALLRHLALLREAMAHLGNILEVPMTLATLALAGAGSGFILLSIITHSISTWFYGILFIILIASILSSPASAVDAFSETLQQLALTPAGALRLLVAENAAHLQLFMKANDDAGTLRVAGFTLSNRLIGRSVSIAITLALAIVRFVFN